MPRYIVAFFLANSLIHAQIKISLIFFVSGAWFIGHLLLRRTIQGSALCAPSQRD